GAPLPGTSPALARPAAPAVRPRLADHPRLRRRPAGRDRLLRAGRPDRAGRRAGCVRLTVGSWVITEAVRKLRRADGDRCVCLARSTFDHDVLPGFPNGFTVCAVQWSAYPDGLAL